MTKSHILLYVVAVLGITLAAYMYTSIAEAPHGLTIEDELVPAEENTNNEVVDQNESKEGVVDNTNAVTSVPEEPEAANSSALLINKTWQWVRTIDSTSVVVFVPKQPEKFRMQFTKDRMSSLTDCNTVGGSYSISGSELSFGPLMSTLMYCEGSDEAVYGAYLGQVVGFELKTDELWLKTNTNDVMVFVSK